MVLSNAVRDKCINNAIITIGHVTYKCLLMQKCSIIYWLFQSVNASGIKLLTTRIKNLHVFRPNILAIHYETKRIIKILKIFKIYMYEFTTYSLPFSKQNQWLKEIWISEFLSLLPKEWEPSWIDWVAFNSPLRFLSMSQVLKKQAEI